MSKRDLYNNIDVLPVMHADVSDDTAQVGAIIDHRDYDRMFYAIHAGTIADADVTFTVLLEEGDDPALADATAVADGDMINTEALAGFQFDSDDSVRKLGYIGNKRYTRMTITPAGNAAAASFSVAAVVGDKTRRPV